MRCIAALNGRDETLSLGLHHHTGTQLCVHADRCHAILGYRHNSGWKRAHYFRAGLLMSMLPCSASSTRML